MNKTAMQEAIRLISEEYPKEIRTIRQEAYTTGLERAIGILQSLLPTERQQIEDAFKAGSSMENFSTSWDIKWTHSTPNAYYDSTYKTS